MQRIRLASWMRNSICLFIFRTCDVINLLPEPKSHFVFQETSFCALETHKNGNEITAKCQNTHMLESEQNVAENCAVLFFYWEYFPVPYLRPSYKCVRHVYGMFCFLFIRIIWMLFLSKQMDFFGTSFNRFLLLALSKENSQRDYRMPERSFKTIKN